MNTMNRTLIALLVLSAILGIFPATSIARQDEPVTWYGFGNPSYLQLDPQLSGDWNSTTAVETRFLGLTDMQPETAMPVPELAAGWRIGDDGLVWTFTLRDDVPWVRWDPVSSTGEIVRMVTADDAAFGIQRACDPRLDVPFQYLVTELIAGCDRLAHMEPDIVTDADYDLVQARALDDVTLEVTLKFPAAYFLSVTTMPVLRPVPRDMVEAYGDTWSELEHLVTNGPFVQDAWGPERGVLLRNPYLPADLQGPGNIERILITPPPEGLTNFELYQMGQLVAVNVTPDIAGDILGNPDYADQLHQGFQLLSFYLGFAYDKPPLDDVHVRRAFSAMLDRQRFIDEIFYLPGSTPMIHFTPPGLFGAPPVNEIGVGFDPDYARAELALAGYPDCQELPPITLITEGPGIATFFVSSAETILGCDAESIIVEIVDEDELLVRLDPDGPPDARPHIWTAGWWPDYPDANNYVGDVLSCDGENTFKRPCTEVDDLIFQASIETDLLTRADLYREIESRFFDEEGEFPLAPLLLPGGYSLIQPWFSGPANDGLIGGQHFDWYTIDQEAQRAMRGE